MGMGSMTGRVAGFCAGNNMPGYLNNVGGRGYGMNCGRRGGFGGRGGGFGRRNRFYTTGVPRRAGFGGFATSDQNTAPEVKKQALQNQADYLQNELDSIRKKLEEIDKEAGK
jgi:hypothetical protein